MVQEKKGSALKRPVHISAVLAEVIGKGPMPRTEVTQKVWAYIKKHNRQDPQNKRNILPDDKLAKVFGSPKPINMFEMTKVISKHLSEIQAGH
ncbi:MAG: SWIB/MDM2 domain-containing protein [Chlamydiales bacterium]|nr:SWIB/MDM2 domain-containing protein [Chlamydiales bacterium]